MEHKERVRKILEKIAKEQKFLNPNIEIKAVNSGGANYTSQLFLATISEQDRDDVHVFAKAAAMGAALREQFRAEIYDMELYFYKDLLKAYKQIEEKNSLPAEHRLKVPVYYGADDTFLHEVLVLEDLVKSGFSSFDRFTSVTWQYAASAITELAKFHALSMAHQKNNPEKFEELITKYKLTKVGPEKVEFMFERAKDITLAAVREENKARLAAKLKTMGFEEYKRLLSPMVCPVLLHGDYRPSNLLHKINNDGTLDVVAVDFQTLRGGCPVVDLLYFIFTGTDSQFRSKYYQQLVDHYYEELRAALIRLGVNPDEKYSREDFDLELEEKLPFGLAVAVFTLPIVTVEEENAPKVEELADFAIQKTGSLFPERLNGVVDDYVRWGII